MEVFEVKGIFVTHVQRMNIKVRSTDINSCAWLVRRYAVTVECLSKDHLMTI